MSKVWNIYDPCCPKGAVLIDRATPWGNKFVIGRDGTRDEVCDKFESYVAQRPLLIARAKRELRGKDLKCHCAPKRCHGETWLRIVSCD